MSEKTIAAKSSSFITRDHDLIRDTFLERHPGSQFVVELQPAITWSDLAEIKKKKKRSKRGIESIDYLKSNIPYFNFGTSLVNNRWLKRNERTGLFAVKMRSGKEVLLLKRLIGSGKNLHVQTMYCTDVDTEKEFLQLMSSHIRVKSKPKFGIWKLIMTGNGVAYVKAKLPNPPVIHQTAAAVERSITNYFENKERYLRNRKSGAKRLLVYGVAGGGKTTLCYQIAHRYQKTHCVVFATDIGAISAHTAQCAKDHVPTIVFAEECDRWMSKIESTDAFNPHSDTTAHVKAFLDGHLSQRNEAGELDVLITNYPDRIERTIILRPGRVHERIEIGPLDAEHAFEVAKFYFRDEENRLVCAEDELRFFQNHGMKYTGAQIENIAGLVMDYVNGTDIPINADTIKKVVDEFRAAIHGVKTYKDKPTVIDDEVALVGFTGVG